jgi:hypothetical protein
MEATVKMVSDSVVVSGSAAHGAASSRSETMAHLYRDDDTASPSILERTKPATKEGEHVRVFVVVLRG